MRNNTGGPIRAAIVRESGERAHPPGTIWPAPSFSFGRGSDSFSQMRNDKW